MRCSIISTALLLAACGGAAASPTIEASPVTPGAELAPTPDGVAAAAGDRAAFTFFVRPSLWPEFQRAVRTELAAPPEGYAERLLSASFAELLPLFGAADLAAMLAELRGVDEERPLIVRIGEAEDDGLAAILRVAEQPTRAESGLRHVVAVPARDVHEVRASLEEALRQVCDRGGERRCPGGLPLTFAVRDDWVFAVLGTLDAPLRGAEPGPIARWALDARWPAAVYVRPEAFQSAGVQTEIQRLQAAIASADASSRAPLLAQGLGEVLTNHMRMTPEANELQELAIALRSSPASLAFVGRFSAATAAALANAGAPDAPRNPPRDGQFLVLRSGLDLVSAAQALPPPHAVVRDSRHQMMVSLVQCGTFCRFADAVQPLGGAHLALDHQLTDGVARYFRYEQDPAVAHGTLEGRFDIRGLANASGARTTAAIARSLPALHLRASVEGRALGGAIGASPDLPFRLPALETPAADPIDSAQLACLEGVQLAVTHALAAAPTTGGGARSLPYPAARAAAAEALSCLTDPGLRVEGQATLRALDAITALGRGD
ncbi:MAG: hypothetical protein CMN30_03950 [Sandaracinus sp.]|nr:hypothetical protein [Sandaracinus sp.]